MREVWGLLSDRVDYIFSGHSHHWMTTRSGVRINKEGLYSGGSARFSVVGTGGFELDSNDTLRSHALIEKLDSKHFGFALLNLKTSNLTV
jgi:hypothetical protein